DARAEARALGLHLGEPLLDLALLHLEVGDAVAQQSADTVVAFVHGDGVPGARQLLGGREAGRAGAHDGDRLASEALRRMRCHPALLEGVVDDLLLDLLDRDRRLIDAEHARRLARCGAEPTGELREVVGRVQALDGIPVLASPREVVPFRNEVAERASRVAERHAAIHAAAGLATQLGAVLVFVDLAPVHDAHGHRTSLRQLALARLQESLGVSHDQPPVTSRIRPHTTAPSGSRPSSAAVWRVWMTAA